MHIHLIIELKQVKNQLMIKNRLKHFLLAIGLMYSVGVFGLNGNYTINAQLTASNNYKSIGAAVNDLVANGVTGSVVFEIADGVYNESISITKNINGLFGSRRVLFVSKSRDSSKVIIKSAANDVIYLSTSNLSFEHLGIRATGFGNDCFYLRSVSNITIKNCDLTCASGAAFGYGIFAFSGANINVENCDFTSGHCNIYVNNYNSFTTNLNIINNTFNNASTTAVYLRGLSNFKVNNNQIGGIYPHDFVGGVTLFQSGNGSITGNRIIGGYKSLEVNSLNKGQVYNGDSVIIANNYIENRNGLAALSVTDSWRTNIYHNHLIAARSKAAYFHNKNFEYSIVNNYIMADSSQYIMTYDVDPNAQVNTFDYNIYAHRACNNLFLFNQNTIDTVKNFFLADTLSNLHSKFGFEPVNKINGLPLGNQLASNVGKYIGVTNDIYGNKRPQPGDTAVDIGCIEYKLDSVKLNIGALYSPTALSLGSNNISCQIINSGTQSIINQNFRIGYSSNLGKTYTYDSLRIKSLPVNADTVYTFSKSLFIANSLDIDLTIKIDTWPNSVATIAADSQQFSFCLGISGN
ncbi:MAG: right-handed parallel beta-helix repeat-containing protein, partial [Bacteroidia bacterium]